MHARRFLGCFWLLWWFLWVGFVCVFFCLFGACFLVLFGFFVGQESFTSDIASAFVEDGSEQTQGRKNVAVFHSPCKEVVMHIRLCFSLHLSDQLHKYCNATALFVF